MKNDRSQYYESFLLLSENVGITINDVTRFGTSLMRSENIHSDDFAGDQKTASLYLTFFSLHLPYTFINDKWPDEPFQFLTLLESNISNAKLITSEVSNILNLFERKIAEDIPIQYITNENWYVNRNKFYIDKNVNLPYSYHAGMFENLLGQQQWNNFQVLDMCTGSGCIGISLALLIPDLKVDLVDISSEALSVAQKNIDMYNLNDRVRCIQSDLFSEVENKYDMIITNPPWVGTDVPLSAEAKHQPRIALESGEDGMDHINKILSTATEYLNDENSSLIITEIPMKQFDLIKQHYPNISFEEFKPVNYDGSICQNNIIGSRLLKTVKRYIGC
jgi:ribosomal protein L3 glutamine methyltransferase|tara:strand:- start:128 stop:1129 length:1002 start_codon:yes stop_codon:yes gene_type:complete